MPKREYTPEEITEKLIGFDPTEDTSDPKTLEDPHTDVVYTPNKKPAAESLKAFLEANNITLTVSAPSEGIKTVSDGSVILSAPKIIVKYKD